MNENDSSWNDNSGYSDIQLYPNGGYMSFIPATDTAWMVMGKPLNIRADYKVEFFQNDSIKTCVIAEMAMLCAFGVRVRVLDGTEIKFYENGQLQEFVLAPQKVGFLGLTNYWQYKGQRYNPGTRILLSNQGEIIKTRGQK